jgi:hypothetical protein
MWRSIQAVGSLFATDLDSDLSLTRAVKLIQHDRLPLPQYQFSMMKMDDFRAAEQHRGQV